MSALDRNGLEILERAECLGLLAGVTLGRLAYTHGGVPAVIPINVALEGDEILFRLGTGAALVALYDRQVVALEIEAIDLDACCGWSINVVGAPAEIPAARAAESGQKLRSWLRPDATRLFRLATAHIDGRRLLAAGGSSDVPPCAHDRFKPRSRAEPIGAGASGS